MKRSRWIPVLLVAIALLSTGCAQRTYYAAPPPPPPQASALIDSAEHNGFRAGMEDGARDSYNGFGYHPKHDRKFHDTPGYDPQFGPFGPYQSYFRSAYLRGYDKGFYRR